MNRRPRGGGLLCPRSLRNSSHSSVENQLSAAALSKHNPARPIDWRSAASSSPLEQCAVFAPRRSEDVPATSPPRTATPSSSTGAARVVMLDSPKPTIRRSDSTYQSSLPSPWHLVIAAPLVVIADAVKSRLTISAGGRPYRTVRSHGGPRRPRHETLRHRRLDALLRHPPAILNEVGDTHATHSGRWRHRKTVAQTTSRHDCCDVCDLTGSTGAAGAAGRLDRVERFGDRSCRRIGLARSDPDLGCVLGLRKWHVDRRAGLRAVPRGC